MSNLKKLIFAGIVALASAFGASSQVVALKTNLIGDALLSPNLGVEFGLSPKWSLERSGQTNLWPIDGHTWKHWAVQPELRFWFCRRFAGHFLGLHGIGGMYNFGNINFPVNALGSDFRDLKDNRYQGWAAGAGIAYGYAWPVHKHWNIEAEIGIGWLYTRYDRYPCAVCGNKTAENVPHNYYGPTKAAVSVVYLF